MADKDVALAMMGAAVGLAGLLLVFSGFLLARAAQYETKRGDVYRILAKVGLIPILAAFGCTVIAVWAAEGGQWSQRYLYCGFNLTLAISAVYAIIGLLKA